MAEPRRRTAAAAPRRERQPEALLRIRDLHVFYGQSHALQGVDLTLPHGVLSVVGRNGMGKTTLCKAIMGLVPAQRGSIRLEQRELRGLNPSQVANLGVGYVPQGRRLWRSLTVDEHLRLCARGGSGAPWTPERVYDTFPRLAERRRNGGAQLSGGEQQMLAIARALLGNPRLLVMDEPTEGLAPVIVAQVEDMLLQLAEENIAVLVIEQNIAVATTVSEQVAIMVNGRINRVIDARELAGDRELQERLLGVGRHAHEEVAAAPPAAAALDDDAAIEHAAAGEPLTYIANPRPPTRWSVPASLAEARTAAVAKARATAEAARLRPVGPAASSQPGAAEVLVVGTCDTKGRELRFVRDLIALHGLKVRLVDLSTSGRPSGADVPPNQVAAYHRRGASAVFGRDRGQAVEAMAEAFESWLQRQHGIAGIISAGGSGGTALVTPGMRRLPIGVPKVMISTVASGNVQSYVGPADIMMMYSVTDVQGLNRISRTVLANGANALVGMVQHKSAAARFAERPHRGERPLDLPAIGLTMFGVTTPCVQQVTARLEDRYDCLVFHATGVGGRSMEALVDSGLLAGVLDITTTEVADLLMGGVMAATEDRLGAIIRTRLPYVGSCGALDMVNFGPPASLPERYRGRLLHPHNPQVTLMRTTAEDNERIGRWLGERLNRMDGPVRFLMPEGGVSALDRPGQPFHDPAADQALFQALERTVRRTGKRQLLRLPHHINDAAFAQALADAFEQIGGRPRDRRRAAGLRRA